MNDTCFPSKRVFFGVLELSYLFDLFGHPIPVVQTAAPCRHLGQFLLCLLLRCVRILLLLLEILHDGVQHGDDAGAQVAISGTAQLPSHLGRTRIFLAESCQILGFVEAFYNGLGFLHHFQGEAAVATGGLVGVLLFGSNLQIGRGYWRRACRMALMGPHGNDLSKRESGIHHRKWLQWLPSPKINIPNHHPISINKSLAVCPTYFQYSVTQNQDI